jgi:REase_AHJR-like
MNTQQRLESVADRYRQQGYQVTLNPSAADLPSFAKDFKVELLATRPDGNVLVSAKASNREFERDTALSGYAEIIEKHPGWRYDVFVLAPPVPKMRSSDAADASEDEIRKLIGDSDRLLQAGFAPQAVLTGWAALESSMRHKLRAMGNKAAWGSSPQEMLNDLYSSGALSHTEFRELEGYFRLRNVIAHGFSVPEITPSAITFLAETARRLLEESKPVESAS